MQVEELEGCWRKLGQEVNSGNMIMEIITMKMMIIGDYDGNYDDDKEE